MAVQKKLRLFTVLLIPILLFQECATEVFSRRWSLAKNQLKKLQNIDIPGKSEWLKRLSNVADDHSHRVKSYLEQFRSKRDAPFPNANRNSKLIVHTSQLEKKLHNEAIVHWSGKQSDAMFILTRYHAGNDTVLESTLWRSTDYGSTFREVQIDKGVPVIKIFYTCPSNKNKLIFVDVNNKNLYTTDDEGETFVKQHCPFTPDRLVFHPSKEDWLLGYHMANKKLYMSNDFGKSWDLVSEELVNSRFFWAVGGVDNDATVIHMEVQNPVTGQVFYRACASPYCTDVSNTGDLGTIDVNSLIVQDQYIFLQKTKGYKSTLYVSYMRSQFRKAFFPKNVHPKDFSIISTDEGQVFIAADHREGVVHLYLSDATGQFYIQALDNLLELRKNSGFEVDLIEVKGLKGTYIANQRQKSGSAVTLITFDQGAKWRRIPAPTGQSSCKPPNCSLHLHLTFSRHMFGINEILSEKNAPGIILAQGSLGKELQLNSSVYMSEDGGWTWRKVTDGEYSKNILDQGGAIVLVPDYVSKPVNSIKYSCNYGKDWLTYNFTDKPLLVDGVLNEPGIDTLVVSLFGHTDRKKSGWVVMKLNFSAILSQPCKDTDYYTWTPSDQIKDHDCLMGQKIQYTRRKKDSECFNGRLFKSEVKVLKNCTCIADDDYECDYGFEQKEEGGVCQLSSWFDPTVPLVECPEGEYYTRSGGYRKIASDTCVPDPDFEKQYKPESKSCPILPPAELGIVCNITSLMVETNATVLFNLTQGWGSKKSTKYVWTFGDDGESQTATGYTGYNMSQKITHRFSRRGIHTVIVKANNKAGSGQAGLVVRVEDKIQGIYVEEPHGAQVNKAVDFDVLVTSLIPNTDVGNIHFVWTFGDETEGQKPLLSWKTQITHTYHTAGNYSVTVEAINSVSSMFRTFLLLVYSNLKTVQLTFDSMTDRVNTGTLGWRTEFGDLVKRTLTVQLNVEHSRLEVVVLRGTPTKADVSVLPSSQQQHDGKPIDEVVKSLLQKVQKKSVYVVIKRDSDIQDDQRFAVVKAEVVSDEKPAPPKKAMSLVAIFICVPVLIVAVFVSGLIVMYYKKKFSSYRRYAILQSQSAEPDTMSDDDPLLDSDADATIQRNLGLGLDSDDEPHLVMMTGRHDGHTVDC